MNALIEAKYAKFVSFGLFMTTIIIVAGPVSEPVNIPKLLVMTVFAFGAVTYIPLQIKHLDSNRLKKTMVLTGTYILFLLLASILSASPFSQNLYGILGRNTGLIANIAFAILFSVISLFQSKKSIELLVLSLMAAGIVNILYGLIVQLFGDPIPWSNNYGALLGTLGNPDFAGALYGLVSVIFLAFLIKHIRNIKYAILNSTGYILSIYCVLLTKTTQGILITAITNAIFVLIYVIKKLRIKYLSITLTMGFAISLVLILTGIFQKGPLAGLLYKRSVSLRGVYWDAAFQTGMKHPFTGVGLDSFGDWYRRSRSLKAATWLPGPDTITNVAHNYYLDIFANGGFPLLISYSSFTAIGLISIFKILKKKSEFDLIATILIALFVGFQAQAVISIPQIGIAVWGWTLNALLLSYSRVINENSPNTNAKRDSRKFLEQKPIGVFIFLGMALGFVLAVPPYSADAKWTNALKSGDITKVESALTNSYFSPTNSDRLAQAIDLLERNKFPDIAHKYALMGVSYNPDYFNAWKILYLATNSSPSERIIGLENMKRLDPLNKNLEKLK